MNQFETRPQFHIGADDPALKALVRSVGLRIGVLVMIVGLLCTSVIGLVAFLATGQVYRGDVALLAQTAVRSIERPLSRAADYDVPLMAIPEMNRFLAEILATSPALSRLEILDPKGGVIFSSENGSRFSPTATTAVADITTRAGLVGRVRATASLNEAATPFIEATIYGVMAGVAIAMATGLLAAWLTYRGFARPAAEALERLQRVQAGEVALRDMGETRGEFAQFWRAFRTRALRTSDRWIELSAYMMELEISDYENRHQAAISALTTKLRQRYTLPTIPNLMPVAGTSRSSEAGR